MEAIPTTMRAELPGVPSAPLKLVVVAADAGVLARFVAVSALPALIGNTPEVATCRANQGRAAKAAMATAAPSSNHSAARPLRGRINSKLGSATGSGAALASAATNGDSDTARRDSTGAEGGGAERTSIR